MAQSIERDRKAIGVRAARHLDLIFRHLMTGQGAESGAGFMRLVTGEPHPMGNLAIVCEPDAPESTRAAIGPLLGCVQPTALIYASGVSDAIVEVGRGRRFRGAGRDAGNGGGY